MTVLDLIKSILRKIGVLAAAETPNSNTANDVLQSINLLLQEWDNEGLLALTERQTFNVTSGTQTYTIGPGMTWVGNKPLKIISAYITLDSIDYPLEIIGESEYMKISDKTVEEMPSLLYYQFSNSTGTVYLIGKPDQAYTITILSLKAFTEYSSLTTTISLPKGYQNALLFNVALDTWPEYSKQDPPQWLVRRANETLARIKKTNLKKAMPMQFDGIFLGSGGNYDIESDTFL